MLSMIKLFEIGFDDLEGTVGFEVGGDVLLKDFASEVGCGVGGGAVG